MFRADGSSVSSVGTIYIVATDFNPLNVATMHIVEADFNPLKYRLK